MAVTLAIMGIRVSPSSRRALEYIMANANGKSPNNMICKY